MIAVIQCAASKKADAGYLRTRDGRRVAFVADPVKAPSLSGQEYARPDDRSDQDGSWRDVLLTYNRRKSNPFGLLPAYQLYENDIYRRLAEKVGPGRLYILSAGWGLIPASFLTPYYDITFSQAVKKKAPWKFRAKADAYEDFCMLHASGSEEVVFFGGKSYVPFFARLTKTYRGQRRVFFSSSMPPDAPGCLLEPFETRTRTNWHYECAGAFVDDRIQ